MRTVEARHLKRVLRVKLPEAAPNPAPSETADARPAQFLEDAGLIGLLMGLKFDQDNDPRMHCPSCGEEIAVDKGQCPKCREIVRARDPLGLEAQVLPLVDVRNLVYVHLDVESGHVRYVRKTSDAKSELQELRLEDATGIVPHFPVDI